MTPWDGEPTDRVLELAGYGLSAAEIADRMTARFGHVFTRNAIIGKLNRLHFVRIKEAEEQLALEEAAKEEQQRQQQAEVAMEYASRSFPGMCAEQLPEGRCRGTAQGGRIHCNIHHTQHKTRSIMDENGNNRIGGYLR